MTPASFPILCACGALAVAIDPGHEPEISEAGDVLVRRGRPVTGRRLTCWPMALRVQQDLLGEAL